MLPHEKYRKEAASPSSKSAAIGEELMKSRGLDKILRLQEHRADLGSFAEWLLILKSPFQLHLIDKSLRFLVVTDKGRM